jgi:hypothetical protein
VAARVTWHKNRPHDAGREHDGGGAFIGIVLGAIWLAVQGRGNRSRQ